MLEQTIESLLECAEISGDRATWRVPRCALAMEGIAQDCRYYNLGLARGVLGPIVLLARAHAAEVARSQVEPLLERAVSWLLAHKLPPGSPSVFPRCIEDGASRPERTASW